MIATVLTLLSLMAQVCLHSKLQVGVLCGAKVVLKLLMQCYALCLVHWFALQGGHACNPVHLTTLLCPACA